MFIVCFLFCFGICTKFGCVSLVFDKMFFFNEKLLFLVVCVFFEVWELLSGVSASV